MRHPLPRARTAFRCLAVLAFLIAPAVRGAPTAADARVETVERVKASIVGIGTYLPTRAPAFQFRGTGFVVGDGTTVVTNAHVVPDVVDKERKEVLGILVPRRGGQPTFRPATKQALAPDTDLALLKIEGTPLPALALGDSDAVREGKTILFTGFPIGTVLGLYPATHHGVIASIVPIAIPQRNAADLNVKLIRRLSSGPFDIFQLDATAYPGNSGSPVYDPQTGEVLGVVNMVLVKGTRESALSQPTGISYAVPSRHLRELLDSSR